MRFGGINNKNGNRAQRPPYWREDIEETRKERKQYQRNYHQAESFRRQWFPENSSSQQQHYHHDHHYYQHQNQNQQYKNHQRQMVYHLQQQQQQQGFYAPHHGFLPSPPVILPYQTLSSWNPQLQQLSSLGTFQPQPNNFNYGLSFFQPFLPPFPYSPAPFFTIPPPPPPPPLPPTSTASTGTNSDVIFIPLPPPQLPNDGTSEENNRLNLSELSSSSIINQASAESIDATSAAASSSSAQGVIQQQQSQTTITDLVKQSLNEALMQSLDPKQYHQAQNSILELKQELFEELDAQPSPDIVLLNHGDSVAAQNYGGNKPENRKLPKAISQGTSSMETPNSDSVRFLIPRQPIRNPPHAQLQTDQPPAKKKRGNSAEEEAHSTKKQPEGKNSSSPIDAILVPFATAPPNQASPFQVPEDVPGFIVQEQYAMTTKKPTTLQSSSAEPILVGDGVEEDQQSKQNQTIQGQVPLLPTPNVEVLVIAFDIHGNVRGVEESEKMPPEEGATSVLEACSLPTSKNQQKQQQSELASSISNQKQNETLKSLENSKPPSGKPIEIETTDDEEENQQQRNPNGQVQLINDTLAHEDQQPGIDGKRENIGKESQTKQAPKKSSKRKKRTTSKIKRTMYKTPRTCPRCSDFSTKNPSHMFSHAQKIHQCKTSQLFDLAKEKNKKSLSSAAEAITSKANLDIRLNPPEQNAINALLQLHQGFLFTEASSSGTGFTLPVIHSPMNACSTSANDQREQNGQRESRDDSEPVTNTTNTEEHSGNMVKMEANEIDVIEIDDEGEASSCGNYYCCDSCGLKCNTMLQYHRHFKQAHPPRIVPRFQEEEDPNIEDRKPMLHD